MTRKDSLPPLRFLIYSDYLCPWCYNASVRWEKLELEFESRIELEWRSFLLRPQPEPGRSLEKFRNYTKSWRRPAAEEDSGEFQPWEGDTDPPTHSVPAHLAAKAAASVGPDAFRRMHRRLLRAYFGENRNISERATLEALWTELELPKEAFARMDDPELSRLVLDEHNEALNCGATGVPAVRLDGIEAVVTGAQPTATCRRWVERMLERRAPEAPAAS